MNQVETGKKQEERAALFLQKQGMKVLFKNYRCRQGEVDLIGIHGACLVFVEVKYRKDERQGMPEEAVGVKKQMKICRTSDYFRICHPKLADLQIRYDVVALTKDAIRWHQDAFPYQESGQYIRW